MCKKAKKSGKLANKHFLYFFFLEVSWIDKVKANKNI